MALVVKNPPANVGDKRLGFSPWIRKIPWRRAWQPTPVFLPGESHGQRSLVGYSLQGCKESDTTEVTWHAHSSVEGLTKHANLRTNLTVHALLPYLLKDL